jgi:hypothetical protein
MADITDINVDADRFRIGLVSASFEIDRFLKDHVDDLAREIETTAKALAPKGPTGRLKTAGVIRDSFEDFAGGDPFPSGSQVSTAHAIGGGFSVKGAGGRFIAATKLESPGHVFTGNMRNSSYFATVQLNPAVKHAKWVHEGTGLFGPYHTPIVPKKPGGFLVFYWHGRKWVKRSVKGQKPQPFLTEAFEYVRNVYEPAKLAQLRAEIDAVT